MKKLIYGITILCLMFLGLVNVNALGEVNVSVTDITIEEGGSGTFKIIVDNAIARANINSLDNNVAMVSQTTFLSSIEGKNVKKEYPITVSAIGKAGDTTTVEVEVYDATTFDEESLASVGRVLKYEINVTIVEKGSLGGYTVTYDANGGSDAPAAQTKEHDKELILSNDKPVYKGYEFLNWNTAKDGSGNSYLAGGKYNENASVTLYAQWKNVGNPVVNPDTGDSAILIILAIALTFGGYTYWYMKKAKEN